MYDVYEKGNPVPASQDFARKVRKATNSSRLDWLLTGNESVGNTESNDVAWPTIPEEWPQGYLSAMKGETLRGNSAMRWSTGQPQQKGDDFVLDMGNEHPVRKVTFLQGTQHQWDRPKQWSMTLSDSSRIVKEVEGSDFIEVELEVAIPVRLIGVQIVEPRGLSDRPPATCWAVDNIRVE